MSFRIAEVYLICLSRQWNYRSLPQSKTIYCDCSFTLFIWHCVCVVLHSMYDFNKQLIRINAYMLSHYCPRGRRISTSFGQISSDDLPTPLRSWPTNKKQITHSDLNWDFLDPKITFYQKQLIDSIYLHLYKEHCVMLLKPRNYRVLRSSVNELSRIKVRYPRIF
jgi:hypothetical protein